MREPVVVNGVTRWMKPEHATAASAQAQASEHAAAEHQAEQTEEKPAVMPILREEIGEVLRDIRQRQGRTLREVSHDARVSLGYLSEVERGQKEASSELLASISAALEVPMSVMLREVSDRIAIEEGVSIPDSVPEDLNAGFQSSPAAGATRHAGTRQPHQAPQQVIPKQAAQAGTAATRSQQSAAVARQRRAAAAQLQADARRAGLTPQQLYQRGIRPRRHTTGGYQYQGNNRTENNPGHYAGSH